MVHRVETLFCKVFWSFLRHYSDSVKFNFQSQLNYGSQVHDLLLVLLQMIIMRVRVVRAISDYLFRLFPSMYPPSNSTTLIWWAQNVSHMDVTLRRILPFFWCGFCTEVLQGLHCLCCPGSRGYPSCWTRMGSAAISPCELWLHSMGRATQNEPAQRRFDCDWKINFCMMSENIFVRQLLSRGPAPKENCYAIVQVQKVFPWASNSLCCDSHLICGPSCQHMRFCQSLHITPQVSSEL